MTDEQRRRKRAVDAARKQERMANETGYRERKLAYWKDYYRRRKARALTELLSASPNAGRGRE